MQGGLRVSEFHTLTETSSLRAVPNRSPEGDHAALKGCGQDEGSPWNTLLPPGAPKAEGFHPHKSRGCRDRHKRRRESGR